MSKFTALLVAVVMAALSAANAAEPQSAPDLEYRILPETAYDLTALIEFTPDASGIFLPAVGRRVTEAMTIHSSDIYAYCPKSALIFFNTPRGNYRATVAKELNKLLKNDKRLRHLKIEETSFPSENMSEVLRQEYDRINESRRKAMADSIAHEKVLKARADSLAAIERKAEERRRRLDDYRTAHAADWRMVPLDRKFRSAYCQLCDESHSLDTVAVLAMSDMKWLYTTLDQIHLIDAPAVDIPARSAKGTAWHLEAFADSLTELKRLTAEQNLLDIDRLRKTHTEMAEARLKRLKSDLNKLFPSGAIEEWSWNCEYGLVTFSVSYFNSTEKTIKYIDYHFVIKNDVDDVRCRGHFKGTGPVSPWDTGSWEWDSSGYWTAGDSSNMSITKVIITYMNGSQKVLTGNAIKYLPE